MGYKIQKGQVDGLISSLDELETSIINTGQTLLDEISDTEDSLLAVIQATGSSLSTSLANTGTSLSSRIALTGLTLLEELNDYQLKTGDGGDLYLDDGNWNNQLLGAPNTLKELMDFIDGITFQVQDTGGDNLGDHRATGNINLNTWDVTGFDTGNWTGNLAGVDNSLTGVIKKFDLFIGGVGAGDNLGNHTATQNLNMSSQDITGVRNITGNRIATNLNNESDGGFYGDGRSLTIPESDIFPNWLGESPAVEKTFLQIFQKIDALTLNQLIDYNGVTGNLYIATNISGKNIYGSGSDLKVNTGNWNGNLLGVGETINQALDAIDNLTLGDNLGNHTASQNLNMDGLDIISVGGISAVTYSGNVSATTVNTGAWTGHLLGVSNTVQAALDAINDLSFGDNLGDHTATQNLNINGYKIIGASYVGDEFGAINSGFFSNLWAEFLTTDSDATIGGTLTALEIGSAVSPIPVLRVASASDSYISGVTGDNILVSTGTWNNNLLGVTNTLQAAFDAIDNLALGDNLGNHTATQDLSLGGFNINNADTGNFSTLLGFGSDITAYGTASFTGTLSSVPSATGLKHYLDIIDGFSLGGGGGTVSELKLSAPFNYMNLSKAFGTGLLGWAVEEEDISYCYSAGGYETNSTTLHSGTVWLDVAIPYGATGFAPTGCVDITFVADTGSSEHNKIDITFLTSSGNMTNNSTRYVTGGWCPSSAGVPQVFSLNASDLLDSSLSGHSRAKFKFEWYSISGYSVKMIDGALNFVG